MFGVPYHFLIVHFPVALMIGALFCDLRGRRASGYRLNLWGAASSAAAILTGLMLSNGQTSRITTHAGFGLVGALLSVALGMLRYSHSARSESTDDYPPGFLVIESLSVLAIIVAAITGHRAVLGY